MVSSRIKLELWRIRIALSIVSDHLDELLFLCNLVYLSAGSIYLSKLGAVMKSEPPIRHDATAGCL